MNATNNLNQEDSIKDGTNQSAIFGLMRILWGKVRRMDREALEANKVYFLKRNPFFEDLTKKQIEILSKVIYERNYLTNELIFEVGQPGAALFVVQSGEVSIETIFQNGQANSIAVLGKYSFFGELALLSDDPRSASARALVPTRLFALFKKDLEALCESHPDISTKIFRSLATVIGRRLKASNEFLEKRIKSAG